MYWTSQVLKNGMVRLSYLDLHKTLILQLY